MVDVGVIGDGVVNELCACKAAKGVGEDDEDDIDVDKLVIQ